MSYIGGFHSLKAALGHKGRVQGLWLDEKRQDQPMREILALAATQGIKPQLCSKQALDKLLPNARHQGMVAEVQQIKTGSETDLEELLAGLQGPAFLLVLDGIKDPHNLGACLRTADAAGVHAVLAPKDRSVGLTPAAIKVASGAAEHLPFIQVTNLARTLKMLARDYGIWILGLAGEAQSSLWQADLKGPLALVLGSEAEGLRRLTREHCDQLLSLPMQGSVASLNASVAAGVALFEALRQRSG
jgi:23S rRNA (guanosine2251-2'-O)-methyltransferase